MRLSPEDKAFLFKIVLSWLLGTHKCLHIQNLMIFMEFIAGEVFQIWPLISMMSSQYMKSDRTNRYYDKHFEGLFFQECWIARGVLSWILDQQRACPRPLYWHSMALPRVTSPCSRKVKVRSTFINLCGDSTVCSLRLLPILTQISLLDLWNDDYLKFPFACRSLGCYDRLLFMTNGGIGIMPPNSMSVITYHQENHLIHLCTECSTP